MSYSALIDLVGVRERAFDEPDDYLGFASEFRAALERVFSARKKTRIYFFRDHCYIEEPELTVLLDGICELRVVTLLDGSVNIRGVISAEGLKAKALGAPMSSLQKERGADGPIRGFQFGVVAARLFGRLEMLKGIGISVDGLRADIKPHDLSTRTMLNYYVSEGRGRQYTEFRDVRFRQEELTTTLLDHLVRTFMHSRASSKKVARFFVPALVNFARCMDIAGAEPSFEEQLTRGRLSSFRDVSGMELVYLTLADRAYGLDERSFHPERLTRLKRFLTSSTWLHNLLRTYDSSAVPVPDAILTPISRRKFLRDAAETHRIRGRDIGNQAQN
jgi:hypothetical protein